MLKRIPPPFFWIVLVGVVFALGYRIFIAMQPEQTASDAATTVAAAAPNPAGSRAASPRAALNVPASAPSSAPSQAMSSGPSSAPSSSTSSSTAGAPPSQPSGAPSSAASSEPSKAPQAQPSVRQTAAARPAARPGNTVAFAPKPAGMSPSRWAADGDFTYSGHWEHVRGTYDGRTNGSSSRSFRPGSRAMLTFEGRFVRLYGVVGPGGGLGTVDIDGRVKRMVDFYAVSKSAHKLVFSSPPLQPGTHHLTLSVILDEALPVERSHYVNIDGAEVNS